VVDRAWIFTAGFLDRPRPTARLSNVGQTQVVGVDESGCLADNSYQRKQLGVRSATLESTAFVKVRRQPNVTPPQRKRQDPREPLVPDRSLSGVFPFVPQNMASCAVSISNRFSAAS